MLPSLVLQGGDSVESNSFEVTGNPVISVGYDGSILGRFDDNDWPFAFSKACPNRYYHARWPKECGPNLVPAKQLAFMCLVRGKAMSAKSIYRKCCVLAAVAVYCTQRDIELADLHRHPRVVVDLIQSGRSHIRKRQITAIGRLALALREELGWTFLEHDQIDAIERIGELQRNQYAVIPRRIYGELDGVAQRILSGYLSVADQFDEVSAVWQRTPVGSRWRCDASFEHLLSTSPLLASEIANWGSRRLAPYIAAIRSAAIWAIGGGSCARRSEILSVRTGCLTRELVGDNIAYLLRGETTKTQSNTNAIWVVSPRVELAIKALERLLVWYERTHPNPPNLSDYLFQIFDLSLGRHLPPSQRRAGKVHHGTPLRTFDFRVLTKNADTQITADDWAEAKRLTPSIDENKFAVGKLWTPSAHQLRRTVMVYAAASGLVSQDSLSFQAKHQTWQMTRYYCENYWHLANISPDDPLVTSTQHSDAEAFTRIFADAYNQDRLEAMGNDQFFSPYGQTHKRAMISATPVLSLEEIRTGLARRVLKRNTLGLCAQSEPCEWQKAITVRGCMTKADGNVCARAIFDAGRENELQALQENLTYQLESLHARDEFAKEQLEADISATAQAIEMIKKHKGLSDGKA